MEIYPVLWMIVAIISLIPVYIFWIGYRKLRTRDLFITAIAFTLFFVKALTLSIALFEINELWYANDEFWLAIAAILDIIIIGLIAFSFSNRFNPHPDIDKPFPLEDEGDEPEKESDDSEDMAGNEKPSIDPDASPLTEPSPGEETGPTDQDVKQESATTEAPTEP